MRYFTKIGKHEFQHITASARIELIDQKSASVTHRAVKFAYVPNKMHAFAGGHEALLTTLMTFNLSCKFRFPVAFLVLMLGFRFTLWWTLCASVLHLVVRVRCRRKKFTFAISSVDELLVLTTDDCAP